FGRHERFEVIALANSRPCTRPVRIGARLRFSDICALVSAIVWKDIFEFGTEALLDGTAACFEFGADPVRCAGIAVVAFGFLILCLTGRSRVFFSGALEQRV